MLSLFSVRGIVKTTLRSKALSCSNLREYENGRDECNLAEFPVAVLTDRVNKGVKTIEFSDTVADHHNRRRIVRRVCITGSDKFGLPMPMDEEVLLALVQLTRLNNFQSPEVSFTKHQVIELLHWPRAGWAYRRVEESMHRWAGVSIHYGSAWRDHGERTWRDSTALVNKNQTHTFLWEQEPDTHLFIASDPAAGLLSPLVGLDRDLRALCVALTIPDLMIIPCHSP